LVVSVVTFILFSVALFTKGFTHDLLLEAGIFLVSVKRIVMAYKGSVANREIKNELRDIKKILTKNKD